MASNVDKLSKFNSAINHYAESQREKILKDIADYQARELEETAGIPYCTRIDYNMEF